MKRRRLALVAVAVACVPLAVFVCPLVWGGREDNLQAKMAYVSEGMSLEDVEAIFGRPADRLLAIDTVDGSIPFYWDSPNGRVSVVIGLDGVHSKRFIRTNIFTRWYRLVRDKLG